MKIYIVEDSEIIRHRVIRLLSSVDDIDIVGFTDDINIALDNVKNLLPDVIILDVSVEKGKGLVMIKEFKSNETVPKVIMFTNYDFQSYKDKSFAYGADYYIDKSNEFQKLPEILDEIKKKINYIELTGVL